MSPSVRREGERGDPTRPAARRLPHAALDVRARDHARHRAARGEVGELVLLEGVGHGEAGKKTAALR